MESVKIRVQGDIVCFVTKYRHWSGKHTYEISFPIEETFKSVHRDTATEVYQWLDCNYGQAMWVCE